MLWSFFTNTTYILPYSINKMKLFTSSASECILLLVFLTSECPAIVILNIYHDYRFVKQHQLQRRSTYLIIHLAMVDLLVGGVSLLISLQISNICFQWDYESSIYGPLPLLARTFFPLTSLVNLAVISLEWVYATFFPFKHRFIKKWVYWSCNSRYMAYGFIGWCRSCDFVNTYSHNFSHLFSTLRWVSYAVSFYSFCFLYFYFHQSPN